MKEKVIIVGAGPAGMACALELGKRGFSVQIVERRTQRSEIGKATGINQATFRWLEKQKIRIDDAIPMRHFIFHDDDRKIAAIQVPEIDGMPPAFMFPQTLLESRLEGTLQDLGCTIRYGAEAGNPKQTDRQASLAITDTAGNTTEASADWIIAADGGHSPLREALAVKSFGRSYPEQWQVGEIVTDRWNPEVQAQLHLHANGTGLFLSQPATGIIQGILNGPLLSAAMQEHFPGCSFRYLRDFRVYLKQVENNCRGRFWFIGDAAHTQSPVGGQGLNLAISDAVTLGTRLGAQTGTSVEQLLSRQARRTLLFTDFDYRMLSTRSGVLRRSRNLYWQLAARQPSIARWFFRIIAGL